ncbi:MAG: metal-dependent hydrolase [Acidobacteria bacterium]|nr:metal-dependent hydrolase [Acidobacteriota bacterium]
MEPLTHLLTGACMSRAGLNRATSLATAVLVVSAEIPDLDAVANLGGPVLGFAHHRGFTHTLAGAPLNAALALAVVYGAHRLLAAAGRVPRTPPRWKLLFVYGMLGSLSHTLLDFTNSYGVRPFAPFYNRWYSWDIVHIVEPLILVALIAGLALPSLFALIQEEVTSHRVKQRGRGGAIFAFTCLALIWLVRDFQHRQAVAALDSRVYQGAEPLRVSAFPYPVNPFRWHGVVETEAFYEALPLDSRAGEIESDDRAITRYKPEETPVIQAAKQSDLGRVYLDWAQYPVIEVEPLDSGQGGYLVRFYDLRYMYPNRETRPLAASLELDERLKVVAEGVGKRVRRR